MSEQEAGKISLKRRIAKYIVGLISWLDSKHGNGIDIDIEKPQPLWKRVFYDVAGQIYYYYQRLVERYRIYALHLVRKFSSLRIAFEIVWRTKEIIFLLISLTFIPLIYYFLQKDVFSLSQDALINILVAYSGGLAALLGIIFALYAVGFQTSTEKFSSGVVDYLNSEQVGRFLFKLLTFSTLFSLANLILQYSTTTPVFPLFTISTFLVSISILGILVFKDDYVTKLKPKQVFIRLKNENLETIRRVNAYESPVLKNFRIYNQSNIKSLKLYLPSLKSWSIVKYFQKHTENRMDIHETLYRDLIRGGKFEDAALGIVGFGYLLAEYISVKHFIDKEFAWWFPKYQELVKADNPEMISIKLNYESKGIGRLGIEKSDYDWLENKVLRFLNEIQTTTDQVKNPLICNALITAYEVMLYGSSSRTQRGYEKSLSGVFESQDFELTKKILEQFIELGYIVNGIEECRGSYINSFGRIMVVIQDGFSTRHFPGKLEDWKPNFEEKLGSLIQDRRLSVNQRNIVSWNLPKYLNSVALDYFYKLEVEQVVEGDVKTPMAWLVAKALEISELEEEKQVDELRRILINGSLSLSEEDQIGFYKNHFAGILLSSFNQLIDQKRWEELDKIIRDYGAEIFNNLKHVDREAFLDTGLRELIDIGVFSALVRREKNVYQFYLKLFFLVQIHLSNEIKSKDNKDGRMVLPIVKRPLMLGALAYLVSELDQDFSFVTSFVHFAERLYTVPLAEIYKDVTDVGAASVISYMNVLYEEASRYRHYYRDVINSISDLPVDHITSGSVPFGLSSTQTVKHPSIFIREMASSPFSDMEQCFEGFVEWLEQQEKGKQVLNLVSLLKRKIDYEKNP